MTLSRRTLFTGLAAIATPAIVRAGSLMPVKALAWPPAPTPAAWWYRAYVEWELDFLARHEASILDSAIRWAQRTTIDQTPQPWWKT